MNQKKLIIYGNGLMARMFFFFARLEFDVAAFTVDRDVLDSKEFEGRPVIPFDTVDKECCPGSHQMITAVGYLEMNRLRARKYEEAKALGYSFATYLHPSVVRHDSVNLGENNVILDHVSIHPYTQLGNSNFICSNTSIGHGCHIHDNCWINSGVTIAGETTVRSNVFLGVNAAIGDDITIEERCYIGANTLITQSTQRDEVYVSGSGQRFPLSSGEFLQYLAGKGHQHPSAEIAEVGPSGRL